METILAAVLVLTAQERKIPQDALVGVWQMQSGPTFIFETASDATFVLENRIARIQGVKSVPNGTWLGNWQTVHGYDERNRSLNMDRWVRASHGTWRIQFDRFQADGYPQSAAVEMFNAKSTPIGGKELTFVCNLDRVLIEGSYEASDVTLNFKNGRGEGVILGRKYAFGGSPRGGRSRIALLDPSTGTKVACMLVSWMPSEVALGKLRREAIPTDQIHVVFSSHPVDPKELVTRVMKRKE